MQVTRYARHTLIGVAGMAIAAGTGMIDCSGKSSTAPLPDASTATSISVAPAEGSATGAIPVGGAARTYVVRNESGTPLVPGQFTWTLRNEANTGPTTIAALQNTNEVRCLGVGRATLVVQATAKPTLQNTAAIDCGGRSVRISDEPAGKTLVAGPGGHTYGAQLLEPNGTLVTGGWTFAWSSSDPTIAMFTAGGGLTPIRAGTVTITATSEGAAPATTTLVVTPGPAYLRSNPAGPDTDPTNSRTNVAIGGTRQYQLVSAAGVLETTTTVWSSSSTAVATVTPSGGLATCVGNGYAIINAQSATLRGRAVIICGTP